MLTTAQNVIVMYPYDTNWWEKEGFVAAYEGDDFYLIEDINDKKISIHIGYLKY
jgi:hypothetical protein